MNQEDEHMIYLAVERAVTTQVENILKQEYMQQLIRQAVADCLSPHNLEDIIDTVVRESSSVNEAIEERVIGLALQRIGEKDG